MLNPDTKIIKKFNFEQKNINFKNNQNIPLKLIKHLYCCCYVSFEDDFFFKMTKIRTNKMANIIVICLNNSKTFSFVNLFAFGGKFHIHILFLCKIIGSDDVGGGIVYNNGKGQLNLIRDIIFVV